MVAQAQEMCACYGFQSVKLKGGVLPPDEEVRTIFALREAFGPDAPLRIDPNAAWSVETAVACGRQMAGVLEYYEDPVKGKEAMADVARQVAMPLATNMCCVSFADLPETLRLGSVQILLSDHHIWGGLLNSVRLGQDMPDLGPGPFHALQQPPGHLPAGDDPPGGGGPQPDLRLRHALPVAGRRGDRGGKRVFRDGSLPVPTEPGLGAKLDYDALARLHENYQRAGLGHRDDVVEMQKIEPGWRPRVW